MLARTNYDLNTAVLAFLQTIMAVPQASGGMDGPSKLPAQTSWRLRSYTITKTKTHFSEFLRDRL